MRRILSALAEIRRLQLEKVNAPADRIATAVRMFEYADTLFSGIKPTDSGSQIEEVMTSADFTYALGEFVQRLMVPGYQAKGFDFEQFVKPETAPNFLEVTRYQRRAGLDDLEYVGEKGIARTGSFVDATPRRFRVHRWEKEFDFSMEALVNDDLGYFADTAAEMGRAARRSLEKFVSRMLWNATTVARLVALGALYSTTGRLTSARVSTARMAFNQRLDDRGEPISAALRHIVIHSGLVDTAGTILGSTLVPENGNNAINIAVGWNPIEDPYAPGSGSNLPWMALTDWRASGVVPFILARRAGMPAPALLRKKQDTEFMTSLLGGGADAPPIMGDFHTGNVIVKVADVFGTYIDATEGNLFDNRGAYYSDGTAA